VPRRARNTLDVTLTKLGQTCIPSRQHLALNEHDYCDWSGLNKDTAAGNGVTSRCMCGGTPMMWHRQAAKASRTRARTLPHCVQEILPCVLCGERALVCGVCRRLIGWTEVAWEERTAR
jgi:bisphosphoglycerate-dependent phosphoglycerate mutase